MNEDRVAPAQFAQECYGIYAGALYSSEECAQVLAEVRTLDAWEIAEITVENDEGVPEEIRDTSTRDARILDSSKCPAILHEFERRLRDSVLPFIQETWGVDLQDVAGTQLVQYEPGGHYSAHQDGGGSLAERYFTVLCYLNEDFEGGQTSFPTIPYSMRPATGKVVIFPSTFWHCAEPITRGQKSVLVTWVCGPVPVKWM